MRIHSFSRSVDLRVSVSGPGGARSIQMALDTGATYVVIPTAIAKALGYDVERSDRRITIATSAGLINAPMLTLDSVSVLGAQAVNVPAISLDLPREARFRGLLGLSFLRNFDVDLHFRTGVIRFR